MNLFVKLMTGALVNLAHVALVDLATNQVSLVTGNVLTLAEEDVALLLEAILKVQHQPAPAAAGAANANVMQQRSLKDMPPEEWNKDEEDTYLGKRSDPAFENRGQIFGIGKAESLNPATEREEDKATKGVEAQHATDVADLQLYPA